MGLDISAGGLDLTFHSQVRKWLLHPRHMHNTPFLQTLCGTYESTCKSTCESSVLSETKNEGCPCDFVKSSAWKPEVSVLINVGTKYT